MMYEEMRALYSLKASSLRQEEMLAKFVRLHVRPLARSPYSLLAMYWMRSMTLLL